MTNLREQLSLIRMARKGRAPSYLRYRWEETHGFKDPLVGAYEYVRRAGVLTFAILVSIATTFLYPLISIVNLGVSASTGRILVCIFTGGILTLVTLKIAESRKKWIEEWENAFEFYPTLTEIYPGGFGGPYHKEDWQRMSKDQLVDKAYWVVDWESFFENKPAEEQLQADRSPLERARAEFKKHYEFWKKFCLLEGEFGYYYDLTEAKFPPYAIPKRFKRSGALKGTL